MNFSIALDFWKLKFDINLLNNWFNREAEGELTLCAGDYLLVWSSGPGGGDPLNGYLDGELLDGRRGLVPASFMQRLIGKISPQNSPTNIEWILNLTHEIGDDLLEFHQAVLSTLRDPEEITMSEMSTSIAILPPIQPNNPLLTHTQEDLARLSETQTDIDLENDEAADNGRFILSFSIPFYIPTICKLHPT